MPEDATSIARVALEVWPDEALDAEHISRLIVEGNRSTQIAELDGEVVGFVDGFLTETASGEPRWEVDLLAVSPRAQGHGLGRALVHASLASGRDAGARVARGLIRVDNVASERVFAANDFDADEAASQLWVGTGLGFATPDHGMHVVQVRTFLYDGLWLEQVNVAGLRRLRATASSDAVGAVIPVIEADSINAAADAGLSHAVDYCFWTRRLV